MATYTFTIFAGSGTFQYQNFVPTEAVEITVNDADDSNGLGSVPGGSGVNETGSIPTITAVSDSAYNYLIGMPVYSYVEVDYANGGPGFDAHLLNLKDNTGIEGPDSRYWYASHSDNESFLIDAFTNGTSVGTWNTSNVPSSEIVPASGSSADGVVDGAESGETMGVGFTDGGGDEITNTADSIEGNGGDDTIFGGGGDDTISGGEGNDTISGGAGDDVISGDSDGSASSGGSTTFESLSPGYGNSFTNDDGDSISYSVSGSESVPSGQGPFATGLGSGDGTTTFSFSQDVSGFQMNISVLSGNSIDSEILFIELDGVRVNIADLIASGDATLTTGSGGPITTEGDGLINTGATGLDASGTLTITGQSFQTLTVELDPGDSSAGMINNGNGITYSLGAAEAVPVEPGNDTIDGGLGADTIDGGGGDDTITVGSGDQADGGAGDDTFIIDSSLTAETGPGGPMSPEALAQAIADGTLTEVGNGLYTDANNKLWIDLADADAGDYTLPNTYGGQDKILFASDPTAATLSDVNLANQGGTLLFHEDLTLISGPTTNGNRIDIDVQASGGATANAEGGLSTGYSTTPFDPVPFPGVHMTSVQIEAAVADGTITQVQDGVYIDDNGNHWIDLSDPDVTSYNLGALGSDKILFASDPNAATLADVTLANQSGQLQFHEDLTLINGPYYSTSGGLSRITIEVQAAGGATASAEGGLSTGYPTTPYYDAPFASGNAVIEIDGGAENVADTLNISGLSNVTWLSGPTDDGSGSQSGSFTFVNDSGETIRVNFTEIETLIQPDPDGTVDGASTGETMDVGYTDGDGDQITDGNDTIEGNGGDDTITAGGGDDSIDGGAGDDVILGDGGTSISYTSVAAGGYEQGTSGQDYFTFAADSTATTSIYLNDPSASDGVGDDVQDYVVIENATHDIDLILEQFDTATDKIVLPESPTGVSVSQFSGGFDVYVDYANGTQHYFEIYTDDTSFSTAQVFTTTMPTGGSSTIGDDTIDGGLGADSIDGGAGDDTITVGAGDVADGGTGDDTFIIDPSNTDQGTITINGESEDSADTLTGTDLSNLTWLSGPTDDGTGSFSGSFTYENVEGETVTVNFSEIENLNVTAAGDGIVDGAGTGEVMGVGYVDFEGDVITNSADTIQGNAGNDSIDAGDGNDIVVGGTGADTIDGNDGDDEISGDSLYLDITDYASGPDGAATNLTVINAVDGPIELWWIQPDGSVTEYATIQPGDTYVQSTYEGHNWVLRDEDGKWLQVIEGAPNQTVTYSAEDMGDTLSGGAGSDTIHGMFGDDVLDGGAGDDTLAGGSGDDTFSIEDGFGTDDITGGETGETNGDTLDFSSLTTSVDVTLSGAPEAGTATDGTDTLSFAEIENFTLSNQDDTFSSNGITGSETITALGGNDTINTQGGDDYIDGGDGADSIAAGQGDDTILGGDGDDVIRGQSQSDSIDGGIGNDTIYGGQHDDTITGGADNDSLYGENGVDTLFGGTGDDLLVGGTGTDAIDGGSGDDTITFAEGDSASGGDGDDTFSLADYGEAGTGDITIDGGGADENNGGDTLQLGTLADLSSLNITNTYINASGNTAQDGTVTLDDGSTLTFTNIENVVCFAKGTRVLTPRGEVPIEALQVGDLVVTRDNGPQPITWIGSKHVGAADLMVNPSIRPIHITPEVTGGDAPLIVSPQHGLLLGNDGEETLIRATHLARLQGGKARVMNGCKGVTYLHLMFDAHQIIFTNGAPAESFYPGPNAFGALDYVAKKEVLDLFPELTQQEAQQAYGALVRDFARFKELPRHLNGLRRVAM